MYAKHSAIASALLAAVSFASVAEAAGGVRLNFGGPLGTFVATPANGGGGAHQKPYKRKAPGLQATGNHDKPSRVAKGQDPKAKPKITARAEPATTPTAGVEERAPASTGSSALIQGDIRTEKAGDSATADAPAIDRTARSEADTVAAATEAGHATGGCKKFVPAIGTTVSVGCGE